MNSYERQKEISRQLEESKKVQDIDEKKKIDEISKQNKIDEDELQSAVDARNEKINEMKSFRKVLKNVRNSDGVDEFGDTYLELYLNTHDCDYDQLIKLLARELLSNNFDYDDLHNIAVAIEDYFPLTELQTRMNHAKKISNEMKNVVRYEEKRGDSQSRR